MHIQGAATSPGGSTAAIGTRTVSEAVGAPPQRSYRTTLYLPFATGGQAHGVRVDETATKLAGRFVPYEFEARQFGEATVVQHDPRGLLVDLGALRPIVHLEFDHLALGAGEVELRLYRMDGNSPLPEPFFTRTNSWHFRREYDGGSSAILGGGITLGPSPAVDPAVGDHLIHGGDFVGAFMPIFPVGLIERRFLVRLVNSSGAQLQVNPGNLSAVRVRGVPTNPRIGLAFPAAVGDDLPQAADAVFFWRSPGEILTASAAAGAFGAATGFGAELQRLVKRYASLRRDAGTPELPAMLQAALVFESDHPCRVQVDEFNVGYSLELQARPDGAEKAVARFPAGRRDSAEVRFALPSGARIISGELRLDPTLPGGHSSGSASAAELTRGGGYVAGVQALGQSLRLGDAALVSGVTIALAPLAARPEITLELREDAAGMPGRVVASANMPVVTSSPHWCEVRFDTPALLSTAPYWILLHARAGAVLWVVADAANATDQAPRVVRPGGTPGSWRMVTALEGRHALYRIQTKAAPASPQPPMAVRIGSTNLGLAPAGADAGLHCDVAEALTGSGSAMATELVITLEAAGPGRVTLYPIDLLYDLV